MTKSESQNLYIWFSKVVTAKLHAVFTVIPARKYLVYVVNKICEIYFGLSYGISVLSSLQCQFQTTKICLKKISSPEHAPHNSVNSVQSNK